MLPDVVIAVSSALRQSRPPTPPVAPVVRRAPKAPTATSPVPSGRVLGRAMLHSLGSSSRSVRSPSGNDPWPCITIRSLITAWAVSDRLQQRHGLLAAVWGATGEYDHWSNLSGSGWKTDSNNSIIRPRRPAVVCAAGANSSIALGNALQYDPPGLRFVLQLRFAFTFSAKVVRWICPPNILSTRGR